jgi:hypothetical protein
MTGAAKRNVSVPLAPNTYDNVALTGIAPFDNGIVIRSLDPSSRCASRSHPQ